MQIYEQRIVGVCSIFFIFLGGGGGHSAQKRSRTQGCEYVLLFYCTLKIPRLEIEPCLCRVSNWTVEARRYVWNESVLYPGA